MSNSIAELFFSEGSPAYHSYYYDCREHKVSTSYFLSIAFDPKTRIVATLQEEEVLFYRLFSDREISRAKAPGFGLAEYFDCESEAKFESANIFHLTMKCDDGKKIDLKIKVP